MSGQRSTREAAPKGRTLRINESEAKTIRALYNLYEELGSVREVKDAADRLGLRSKHRKEGDGTTSGGGPLAAFTPDLL